MAKLILRIAEPAQHKKTTTNHQHMTSCIWLQTWGRWRSRVSCLC